MRGLLASSLKAEDVTKLTMIEAIMIYLCERSIIDHVTGILSLLMLGGFAYVSRN